MVRGLNSCPTLFQTLSLKSEVELFLLVYINVEGIKGISSKEQCSKFTDFSLQVALVRVPCSQTSLYRSPLWVRSYGQLQCLLTSLYRSPMAGTKLADLSLQTPLCKEDVKKRV